MYIVSPPGFELTIHNKHFINVFWIEYKVKRGSIANNEKYCILWMSFTLAIVRHCVIFTANLP